MIESSKPDRRKTRHVSPTERIEVLERREDLRGKLFELVRAVTWRNKQNTMIGTSKRDVSARAQNSLLRNITGYRKWHLWDMRRVANMLSGRFVRNAIEALIGQADDDLHELRHQCREQMSIIDKLHDLKELARDRRLFSAEKYPPGDVETERRALSSGMSVRQMRRLMVTAH